MKSTHRIIFKNAKSMDDLADGGVDLAVTSPPYPMIEMWDGAFSAQNSEIAGALDNNDGVAAFELMHRELDPVWNELFRVLKDGGIACVNIGDAVRTLDGRFALYANHSRIQAYLQGLGFSSLPSIIWRKQTNAPNKFMGSGMMPPGAYVTMEHEYILILRKGDKRDFTTPPEKRNRRESAFFWEERNAWFSDVWMDLKGAGQHLFDGKTRGRSAAFPFELPYRLISMFSVKGDTVLDPFLGVGTTLYAAMAAGRNSVGYEIDQTLGEIMMSRMEGIADFSNRRIRDRFQDHFSFVKNRLQQSQNLKHTNRHYQFPVMTGQETDLLINRFESIRQIEKHLFETVHSDIPQDEFTEPGQ